jgi:catechol 2,3-dioxygenase-like lactoylglutathione lyase family enzyme
MNPSRPVLNQVNLFVRDLDATIAFYQRLGLPVADHGGDWPSGSGARHVEVVTADGISLEFDNMKSALLWKPALPATAGDGPATVIGFALESRESVDAVYAELTAAGAPGRVVPYDAFWGARYAVVADPDGNEIGLMSPTDPKRQYVPD